MAGICFIFPPFAFDYPEEPFRDLPGFMPHFYGYLKAASDYTNTRIDTFNFVSDNFLNDELKSQYISYTLSCALADYLKDYPVIPDYTAGYSMGLYASLYQTGAAGFEDGLELIEKAYSAIRKAISGREYRMASIIGLNKDDILQINIEHHINPSIAIQNSVCSFLVSGIKGEIDELMEASRKEGALNTRLLNVTVPYHSPVLRDIVFDFVKFINTITFKPPSTPVISLIDQIILTTTGDVREEIIRNIFTPLNWYKTQLYLQKRGVHTFIECGPAKTMKKNARFIEGNAQFYNVDSWFETRR